ncbi:MAG: amidohydrolase family protein [Planctomycetota bacterium]
MRPGSKACSRREFVARATATALACGGVSRICGAAVASETDAAPADPATPIIIDTHTHFFDPTRAIPAGRDLAVPWPSKGSSLFKTTLPPDWEALARPLGMRGTVVVEASNWLEDNDWILELAERHRSIVGFIGNLSGTAIEQGEEVAVWDDIARFRREVRRLSENPIFRGIRVAGRAVADDASDGRYPHFELLADKGLVVDVLRVPAADVVALAKAVPSLTIIVDHMFTIRDTSTPSEQWKSDITTLAETKSTVLKVSGLVEGLNAPQTDVESALALCRGAIDHAYEAFGPERLMFGSNWPVSQPKATMAVVTGIVREYFRSEGPDVLANVLGGNAKKVYGHLDR